MVVVWDLMSGEVHIASVEGGWAGAMSEYRMLHVVIFRLSWIVVLEGAEAEAIKVGEMSNTERIHLQDQN